MNFVTEDESSSLKPGCLIVDVSCDEGMGFYFAKPTSFRDPMFRVRTVRRAVTIDAGVILNPAILSFQERQKEYPHAAVDAGRG